MTLCSTQHVLVIRVAFSGLCFQTCTLLGEFVVVNSLFMYQIPMSIGHHEDFFQSNASLPMKTKCL